MERITLEDFEAEARARLPQLAYDYYASGADAEVTLERNRAAFAELSLYYRTLVIWVRTTSPRRGARSRR